MPQRVLVVEDEPDNAALLRIILQSAGYDVLLAADIATARSLLAGGPPDLVILDLVLPDGDGLELCRELKAGLPRLPIVVLTAWGWTAVREQALAECADLFMGKPFDLQELEAAVERLLAADDPTAA